MQLIPAPRAVEGPMRRGVVLDADTTLWAAPGTGTTERWLRFVLGPALGLPFPSGPEDGRNSVRLRLDDQEAEFRWDEIGAVETESPRFGKRFTITVHTPDRRWYPIEIEATARARFSEWDEQLDAVLDAYFEEGAENTEDTEVDDAD